MSEAGVAKTAIKFWAEDDRPREKMVLKGKQSLSDAELIAILIASGTTKESALAIAQKLLGASQNKLNQLARLGIKELQKHHGIGHARAITIIAALELGRRIRLEEAGEQHIVKCSSDIYAYFEPLLGDYRHEEFWIMVLSRNFKVLGIRKISEGGVSGTVADPKIIFKYALEEMASSLVLCHNHPSGNVQPSQSDIDLTLKLRDAGKSLDIGVLDHVIIGQKSYYSFADEGIL
jgi:DNA repair protein RadC